MHHKPIVTKLIKISFYFSRNMVGKDEDRPNASSSIKARKTPKLYAKRYPLNANTARPNSTSSPASAERERINALEQIIMVLNSIDEQYPDRNTNLIGMISFVEKDYSRMGNRQVVTRSFPGRRLTIYVNEDADPIETLSYIIFNPEFK